MPNKTNITKGVRIVSNFNELSENAVNSLFDRIGEFLASSVINDNPIDNPKVKVTLKSNNNYGMQQNTDTANLSNNSNECNQQENKFPIIQSSK